MPVVAAIQAKQSVSKGQERHPADPAAVSTRGRGLTAQDTPSAAAAPRRALQHQLPTKLQLSNHTSTPGPISCTSFPALHRVTDTKRISANKLGLDLQLPCASKGCAEHSVVSTWHSSTVPLFFCLRLVQVGLFMSEKHKWEKGPGKDRVKYHLRVKHHLKVTLRALLNLPAGGIEAFFWAHL